MRSFNSNPRKILLRSRALHRAEWFFVVLARHRLIPGGNTLCLVCVALYASCVMFARISSVDYLLRPLNVLGMLLLYSAVFLYEDQEGRIQNLIVQWWVKVDDARITAHSRVALFVEAVAGLTVRGFDRVFGDRLLSFRFLGVSLCLSFASFFLVGAIGTLRLHRPAGAMIFQCVWFVFLALVPIFDDGRWIIKIWWLALLIALGKSVGYLLYILYYVRGAALASRALGYLVIAFTVSFISDICYVAITRWMLRRVATNGRMIGVVSMIAANLVVLCLLLVGPIELGLKLFKYWENGSAVILFSVFLNAIDFAAGSAALILGVALLAHRLLWPVLQHPLYALQEHEVVRNKKLLWVVGLALTFLPTHVTLDWFKALLMKL